MQKYFIQIIKGDNYQISHSHPYAKHLLEVMAAPTKAKITEIHKQKQLFRPYNLSRYTFNTVINIALRGAIIQKIII